MRCGPLPSSFLLFVFNEPGAWFLLEREYIPLRRAEAVGQAGAESQVLTSPIGHIADAVTIVKRATRTPGHVHRGPGV